MSVDYKDMGKRIREIRESKHMTQAALSELAGIQAHDTGGSIRTRRNRAV